MSPMRTLLDAVHGRVRWMPAVSLALLCTMVPLVISAQQAQAPLALVSTAWPPFTNEAGQARFALDLVDAALGRIAFAPKTTIVSAAEFTPALTSSRFDGSAAAWKDAVREQTVLFSLPYLVNRLVL